MIGNLSASRLIFGITVRTLLMFGGVIALNVIVMLDVINFEDEKDKPVILALLIVAFVITLIAYAISAMGRRVLFRVIPCCNLRKQS